MENIKSIIEALILASEAPLVLEKICVVLPETEKTLIKEAVGELIEEYKERQAVCNSGQGRN
jgi:chromosome segregation and condensation protein ScpB